MKADKVWNSRMPAERLAEVLPEGSQLAEAVDPVETGLTLGVHAVTGIEPYLFDADEFVLMGDLTPNGSSWVENIVPLNGDLYVFGTSQTRSGYDSLAGRWDSESGAWSDLSGTASFEFDYAYGAVVLNEDIYFTYLDYDTSQRGVAVLDGATDQMANLVLPVGGSP